MTAVKRDWTRSSKTGLTNDSVLYDEICVAVERLIRNSAHALIAGDARHVARLIVSQMAHVFDLSPPTRSRKGRK